MYILYYHPCKHLFFLSFGTLVTTPSPFHFHLYLINAKITLLGIKKKTPQTHVDPNLLHSCLAHIVSPLIGDGALVIQLHPTSLLSVRKINPKLKICKV